MPDATGPDDDYPFYDVDGIEHCDEETALADLLRDEMLLVNSRDFTFQGKNEGHTIVLFVKCSDLFAWGCADAEDFPLSEVGALWKAHRADPVHGISKWCCRRRNMRPQTPIQRAWKNDGVWEPWLDDLPANPDGLCC